MDAFLAHSGTFHVHVWPDRWRLAIQHTWPHPEAFHPSVENAVFLASLFLCGTKYCALKPLFLSRTRAAMIDSIASVDGVEFWMWAALILACFYAHIGRLTAVSTSS